MELRAVLLVSGAVHLVHPGTERKALIRATPSRERGNPLKIAFFGAESISPLQLQNDAQNANFGPQSHLNPKYEIESPSHALSINDNYLGIGVG